MKNNILLIFAIFILFSSCKKDKTKPNFKGLFTQTFNLIKNESIYNNEIDWTVIEKNINDSIPQFRNNNDVYNGIAYTINLINDKHSFFFPPKSKSNFFINDSLTIPEIEHKIIEGNIGYLKILGLAGNDSLSSQYSLKIRESFKQVDNHPNLSGWIIDLRNNKGGKLGVISLGISPLYRDSIFGISLKNNDEYFKHKIQNNTYFYGNRIANKITKTDTLNNKNKKIAVLVNENTASQAEFIAQSLKFQNNTMIFGTKTKGLTTDIQIYEFTSGAVLGITNAFMCNENKEIINGIIPDVECSSEKSIELAIDWINNAI